MIWKVTEVIIAHKKNVTPTKEMLKWLKKRKLFGNNANYEV